MTTATAASAAHVRDFLDSLDREGFDFHAGVPCSLLAGVIRALDGEERRGYLSAVREDAAIGAAAGAWLGGRRPAVYLQNSGLGVAANALASLTSLYGIPTLLVVSWRGHDGKDAPEHNFMGEITQTLLETLRIPYRILEPGRIGEDVRWAASELERVQGPVALLVRPKILQ